ncbi:hypothetical protein SDC9_210654 [bioreactor metagenome]|uniref:Uncharacterized protein n=1 Tax=bioreactor metagenome TaxID=1076179 RepID=A0A645JH08_9ZZZZ
MQVIYQILKVVFPVFTDDVIGNDVFYFGGNGTNSGHHIFCLVSTIQIWSKYGDQVFFRMIFFNQFFWLHVCVLGVS